MLAAGQSLTEGRIGYPKGTAVRLQMRCEIWPLRSRWRLDSATAAAAPLGRHRPWLRRADLPRSLSPSSAIVHGNHMRPLRPSSNHLANCPFCRCLYHGRPASIPPCTMDARKSWNLRLTKGPLEIGTSTAIFRHLGRPLGPAASGKASDQKCPGPARRGLVPLMRPRQPRGQTLAKLLLASCQTAKPNVQRTRTCWFQSQPNVCFILSARSRAS